VAKYFKYLARDGSLIIDVVTSSDKTLFMPVDEDLRKYSMGFRQIIKVPFFENKYVNYFLRKFKISSLSCPDSKYRFYIKWERVIEELENKPDVIYSRSFPLSSTIMAYYLQEKLQIPWVMHLSDPWTLNPTHRRGNEKSWNDEMERACFKKASIISFTSQETIEMYRNKYPEHASKIVFFPNVYDLEDKRDNDYRIKQKIKVVYTGGLVDERSPEHLFKAILELNKKSPEIIADYEFVFAGTVDRKIRALFEKNIPSVKHVGLLSFNEAIALQENADLLLVIDTPFQVPTDAIFFPSKLLDYMLIQRRIIALTDDKSVTWNLVNKKLGDCIVHKDTNGISQVLIDAWCAWKRSDKSYFLNEEIDMKYSAECNAKRLSELCWDLSSNEN